MKNRVHTHSGATMTLHGKDLDPSAEASCKESYNRWGCTLPAGHEGVHEAWGLTLCAVWGELV